MIPESLFYTKEHEWLKIDGDLALVGITDHAQEQLGDVVFVELPPAGAQLSAGETFGSVESVKAVSDLFAPTDGEVVEVNSILEDQPELLNASPYEQAWIIKVRLANPDVSKELLSAQEYEQFCAEA
ncbi:MAG: glycine cleavage system protein GcvH [Myxococcota bacterium]|jgi:glycine cleavage system H protein|nr:glycine cleavage system protein GcvH [Myxococcota bacterium]